MCGRGGPALSPWFAYPVGGLPTTGMGGGHPRRGWPSTVVGGVWCQALSLPQPPALWGGRPGFHGPCVPGAVDVGMGSQRQPQSVRPCEPSLSAVGVAEGRPRTGCLPQLSGASEFRRSSSPGCPSSGRAVGVRHPRAVGAGVRVWGPGTVPLACMPWWGAACRGTGRGPSPGGVAFDRCEGRLGAGATPSPGARPPGGLPGSAVHVLRARCGCVSCVWCLCGACVLAGSWRCGSYCGA